MKSKIIILTFVGLLAGSLAVSAQTDTTAANTATDAGVTASNEMTQTTDATADTDAALSNKLAQAMASGDTTATTTDATDAAASTNAVPDASVSGTNVAEVSAVDTNAAESSVSDTNAPEASAGETNNAAAPTGSEETAEATETNAPAAPIIPLVVMDDVPLTDAIKNLARQANLNYMLDPKLNYGQIGPNGKAVPQPSVSIRWENVTAEQALYALLDNYDLQLVRDPRTGIARVTAKDPAAPPPLENKVIQLQYAAPSNMVVAVRQVLTDKRSRVIGDNRTSQLIVLATDNEFEAVDKLVARLDKPTKQVLIEAKLVETSRNPTTIKGINWGSTLSAQHFTFGNNVDGGQSGHPYSRDISFSTNGILGGFLEKITYGPNNLVNSPGLLANTAHGLDPATAFLNADGVNAVLSFFNSDSDSKVLSEPRTVTLDNEMAHIEVGQDYPIINVTAGTANTTGGSRITYSNLTVRLDVTPRISANDYVNLRVLPHVMRLDHVQQFTVGGAPFDVPIFDTRDMATTVMIPSGNTLVMGGLMQNNDTTGTTKVPILGDIPLLGYAFRSSDKQRQKSSLLVFVTPTIVQDSDFMPTKTDFLKSKYHPPNNKKWSWWNSTKPAFDWSKTEDSDSEDGQYQAVQ